MKFIGHLDLMRFFQKVFRRCGIDIAFTEGMSPHMILSFAAPLGLGVEGMSEYADIRINTPVGTREALKRLNQVTVEGIEFLDFLEIPDGKSGKAMSLVEAADYAVRFRKGHAPVPENMRPGGENWRNVWESFLNQPSILIERETKNGVRQTEIRPMIYAAKTADAFTLSREAAEKDRIGQNEDGPGKNVLYLRLAAGSAANLKPEVLLDEFYCFAGYKEPFRADPFALTVTRLELYTGTKDGEFTPLSGLGKPIV